MSLFLFLRLSLKVIGPIPATREHCLCQPGDVCGKQASWGEDAEEREEKERKGTSREEEWERRILSPNYDSPATRN